VEPSLRGAAPSPPMPVNERTSRLPSGDPLPSGGANRKPGAHWPWGRPAARPPPKAPPWIRRHEFFSAASIGSGGDPLPALILGRLPGSAATNPSRRRKSALGATCSLPSSQGRLHGGYRRVGNEHRPWGTLGVSAASISPGKP